MARETFQKIEREERLQLSEEKCKRQEKELTLLREQN